MKLSKLFIIALLFSFTFFTVSNAKAEDSQSQNNSDNNSNKNSDNKSDGEKEDGGGSSLPINGQAWFLLIAGTAIGIKVIADKSNKLKLSKI